MPQWSGTGPSGVSGTSTISSPRKTNEPWARVSTLAFLPCHPRPPRTAHARSSTGAESTNARPPTGPSAVVEPREQLAESLAHHVVVVVAPRVLRDPRRPRHASRPRLVVVVEDRDHRPRPVHKRRGSTRFSKWFSIHAIDAFIPRRSHASRRRASSSSITASDTPHPSNPRRRASSLRPRVRRSRAAASNPGMEDVDGRKPANGPSAPPVPRTCASNAPRPCGTVAAGARRCDGDQRRPRTSSQGTGRLSARRFGGQPGPSPFEQRSVPAPPAVIRRRAGSMPART